MKYTELSQLPKKPKTDEEKKSDRFWKHIESDAIKHVTALLILNEVRNCDPGKMTGEEKTASIAKMKAYQELMDFAPFVERKQLEEFEAENEEEEN